jgi:hypothetical protein
VNDEVIAQRNKEQRNAPAAHVPEARVHPEVLLAIKAQQEVQPDTQLASGVEEQVLDEDAVELGGPVGTWSFAAQKIPSAPKTKSRLTLMNRFGSFATS